ncbi:MAG: hypothetical protein GY730_08130 [bacterium]|nr:hypothetical protein [bacterium]
MKKCQIKYVDFKIGKKLHNILNQLKADKKYSYGRRSNLHNPNASVSYSYSHAIFNELDKHYTSMKD